MAPLIQILVDGADGAYGDLVLIQDGRVAAMCCSGENFPIEGKEEHVGALKAKFGIWTTHLKSGMLLSFFLMLSPPPLWGLGFGLGDGESLNR